MNAPAWRFVIEFVAALIVGIVLAFMAVIRLLDAFERGSKR